MEQDYSLIFPGSGSQYVGMGKYYYENFIVAKQIYEEASDILKKDFMKLCFEGSTVKLNRIENLLPALYVTSVAIGKTFLEEFKINPSYSIGHSLGEYSALTCAEAFKFEDCLKLVQLRSQLAKEAAIAHDAGMAIINGLLADVVEKECEKVSEETGETVAVACYNSVDQHLISGTNHAMGKVIAGLTKQNAHAISLIGSAPYHSKLLKPASDILKAEMEKCTIRKPKWRVYSNISKEPFLDKEDIVKNLVLQMYNPIHWETLANRVIRKSDIVIEAGPNNVLIQILKISKSNVSYSLDNEREQVLGLRDGIVQAIHLRYLDKCMKHIVCCPNYTAEDAYDLAGVKKRYKRLQEIYEGFKKQELALDNQIKNEISTILRDVFLMKNASEQEACERFEDIEEAINRF